MTIWFTADTHFNHVNILKYCNRPFRNIGEHDRKLIENWNSVVKPDDTVYHLGDFGLGKVIDLEDILYKLNGKIIFIEGNHDKATRQMRNRFYQYHYQYAEIKINGQDITLCHYAMRVWNKSHHGAWNLYGHSHGTLPDDPNALAIDVGVDCHNYTPISFEKIQRIMSHKDFVPIDHHTGEKK